MARIEKRVEKWRNTRSPVPIEDIPAVLDHYFPGTWEYGGKTGSHHIKVWHSKLAGKPDYGTHGEFTLVVKSGKEVKRWYMDKLLEAIEIIK